MELSSAAAIRRVHPLELVLNNATCPDYDDIIDNLVYIISNNWKVMLWHDTIVCDLVYIMCNDWKVML